MGQLCRWQSRPSRTHTNTKRDTHARPHTLTRTHRRTQSPTCARMHARPRTQGNTFTGIGTPDYPHLLGRDTPNTRGPPTTRCCWCRRQAACTQRHLGANPLTHIHVHTAGAGPGHSRACARPWGQTHSPTDTYEHSRGFADRHQHANPLSHQTNMKFHASVCGLNGNPTHPQTHMNIRVDLPIATSMRIHSPTKHI